MAIAGIQAVTALEPEIGGYRWHYQSIPTKTWDYDPNMDIVLAGLNNGGRSVKALL